MANQILLWRGLNQLIKFEYVLFEKMRLPNFRKGLEAEAGRQAEVGMAVFFLLHFCGPGFLMVFQFYLQISGF
jgi:hypothetical protein